MKAHVINPTLKRSREPSATRTPASVAAAGPLSDRMDAAERTPPRDSLHALAPAPPAQPPTASGRR